MASRRKVGKTRLDKWLIKMDMPVELFARRLYVKKMSVYNWLYEVHMPSLPFMKAIEKETEGYVKPTDWGKR